MEKLVECVPNFSEGNDREVIGAIAAAIEAVAGATLLDVDPGQATNRTVVTFAGAPEPVVEAAFRAVAMAKQRIDMSRHRGEHPRLGATDVCPLVPIQGITMDEVVELARKLARRIGDELGIPVYCYEKAAFRPERRNLADVRAGEYEGLKAKLEDPRWRPDFGPATFDAGAGATVVGARDFLVAYNVNLNTTSTRRANAVAFDVREKGRVRRQGDPLTGPIVRDANGEPLFDPGSLKCVKAIGWYIEEYGIAQISMNLTDLAVTPVHAAFDEVCRRAEARGLRVTGSELVGLIPRQAMLAAGRHFLRKQQRSLGVPDDELIRIAVRSLGLSDLRPFDPQQKIIEAVLERKAGRKKLVDKSLAAFVAETAADSPAPGGGSVAAAVGALGAALAGMVANLSSHKRGWDARWEEFSRHAEAAKSCQDELVRLVDEDTQAFNRLMAAFGLSNKTESEKQARRQAIEEATLAAMDVPLRIARAAAESMTLMKVLAASGLDSAASDAGVGAACARAAVLGAHLNVRTNARGLKDRARGDALVAEGAALLARAEALEGEILAVVEQKLTR